MRILVVVGNGDVVVEGDGVAGRSATAPAAAAAPVAPVATAGCTVDFSTRALVSMCKTPTGFKAKRISFT